MYVCISQTDMQHLYIQMRIKIQSYLTADQHCDRVEVVLAHIRHLVYLFSTRMLTLLDKCVLNTVETEWWFSRTTLPGINDILICTACKCEYCRIFILCQELS